MRRPRWWDSFSVAPPKHVRRQRRRQPEEVANYKTRARAWLIVIRCREVHTSPVHRIQLGCERRPRTGTKWLLSRLPTAAPRALVKLVSHRRLGPDLFLRDSRTRAATREFNSMRSVDLNCRRVKWPPEQVRVSWQVASRTSSMMSLHFVAARQRQRSRAH